METYDNINRREKFTTSILFKKHKILNKYVQIDVTILVKMLFVSLIQYNYILLKLIASKNLFALTQLINVFHVCFVFKELFL